MAEAKLLSAVFDPPLHMKLGVFAIYLKPEPGSFLWVVGVAAVAVLVAEL